MTLANQLPDKPTLRIFGKDNLFGLSTPAAYSLIAQRHFHEYGTTREQLAHIAVACRKHAVLNPNA